MPLTLSVHLSWSFVFCNNKLHYRFTIMLQSLSLIANYRGLEHSTNKNFEPLRSLWAIKGWTPRTLAPQPKESGPARHRQDRKCVLPTYHYQWGCEHGKADKRMLHDINTIILLLKLLKIPAKCCFNWNFSWKPSLMHV